MKIAQIILTVNIVEQKKENVNVQTFVNIIS